jgi:hypothetical protein
MKWMLIKTVASGVSEITVPRKIIVCGSIYNGQASKQHDVCKLLTSELVSATKESGYASNGNQWAN